MESRPVSSPHSARARGAQTSPPFVCPTICPLDKIRAMEEAKVVDLFCGAGGLTSGLEAAGLRVVEGVDVDERCRYPYETNTSARFVGADLRGYGTRNLRDAWKGAKYRILVGCAPCQSFSTYSQRWPAVSGRGRWELIRRFARLVEQTRPHVVSMENVPPLVRTRHYHLLTRTLRETGYQVDDRDRGLQALRGTPDASQAGHARIAARARGAHLGNAPRSAKLERREIGHRPSAGHRGGMRQFGRSAAPRESALGAQSRTHSRFATRRDLARIGLNP